MSFRYQSRLARWATREQRIISRPVVQEWSGSSPLTNELMLERLEGRLEFFEVDCAHRRADRGTSTKAWRRDGRVGERLQ